MNRILNLALMTLLLYFTSPIYAEGGKWIAPANADHPNTWMTFRKDVVVKKRPNKAIAHIAVDSKYWLWVNGRLAVFEGGVKRGPNPQDTYYDEVDLAPFLKKGNNKIALLVWYFGKEGFSHKSSGRAGLLFHLEHEQIKLYSDASWLCRIHPAYGSTEAPHPNYRLPESNLRYDARKELGKWQTIEISDLPGFNSARELGKWGDKPWNKLVKRPIPQWKDFGMSSFKSTERLAGIEQDTLVAYLPYNLQMTPELEVTDPIGGKCIGIYTDHTYVAGNSTIRAEYVTRPGRQIYESLGWFNGHKVFFIVPKGIEVHALRYRETGYHTELSGRFHSDNAFINRFWEKALRTLYVNMRDTYFDCPERERAQWWGDTVILTGESFYTCDTSAHALTRKAIRELVAWQRPDGALFSPIPAGNYDCELPGQMLASIGHYGFWNYYMHTGDRETIELVYPGVKRYLDLWSLDETGLTNYRSGGWAWGDWGTNRDMRLIWGGWHYLALKAASKMALLLGKNQDAAQYTQLMEQLKVGYNLCWNGFEYRHPEYKDCTDDRVQALAVVAGIAPEEIYPKILKTLQTSLHASPYMEKYILEALLMMGEGNYALERMQKRYAPMVNHPFYTTLFEEWNSSPDGLNDGTVNHAWSGGPLIVIAQQVCGITPLEPAYKKVCITPDNTFLQQASIIVPTIAGKIHSSFETLPETFKMKIKLPKGVQGVLKLPHTIQGKVRINGKLVKPQSGNYLLNAGIYTVEAMYQK